MTKTAWTAAFAVTTALAMAAASAQALTPADKCEAGKNKLSGKYAFCRQKAEGLAIKTALSPDYSKCDLVLVAKWASAESSADGLCPTNGDQAGMQAFIADHADAVAIALDGGGLPTCPADLASCTEDLDTCTSGTATVADVVSGETFSSSAGLGLTGTLTYCGDGVQDAGEQCDESSFDPGLTCSGGCLGSCLCRFVDNGDGTVTDNQTRLIWEQKNDSGGAIHDKDNAYTWSSSGTAPDGTVFTSFLATLNQCTGGGPVGGCPGHFFGGDSACFTGNCEWRLPTLAELSTILLASAPCGSNPCVDPIFVSTRSDIDYWTSSTVGASTSSAWTVDFASGDIVSGPLKSSALFVRAVRSGG